MTLSGLTLQPARSEDAAYLYRLLEATMRTYIEESLGVWDEERIRKFTRDTTNDGSFQLLVREGVTIGAIRVERLDTHIQLDQLYISKPYQGQGIGSCLVRGLIAEAQAAGKPLRLRVLRTNPAKALYERLGFVVTEETKERFFMERA